MLLGVEEPRLWTRPLRDLTPESSRGFECIEFAESVLGIRLNPWQRWLLVHLLELNPDGTFRFRTVLVLVARQQGKTLLMQVLALWFLYLDGAPLVLGTAQELAMSEYAWEGALELAESIDELRVELLPPVRVNGQKAMRLKSGERYEVKAATRKAGRGKSARAVLMDELREHQTWDSWSAVSKTTIAQDSSLILGFSNAGDVRSVVLRSLRDRALAHVDDPDTTVAIFEWSAPDGCALDDREAWAQANPSLGYTVRPEAIASALETDPEPVFRTEVLCQWVQDLDEPVIPARTWDRLADPDSEIVGPFAVAVHVNPERDNAAVAVCGAREDGLPFVEVVAATGYADKGGRELVGVGWLSQKFPGLAQSAMAAAGDEWAVAGVDLGTEIEKATASKVVQACAAFYDAVMSGQLRHGGQGVLNASVAGARKRELQSAWAWRAADGTVDLPPVVAATLAFWLWQRTVNVPDLVPLVAYR